MSLQNARKIVKERGAKVLDSIRPGWFREIDVDELAWHDPITQLYGDFWGTLSEIGLEYAPMDYGFCPGLATREDLSIAWREAVDSRLLNELPAVFD